jgi:hypothetical protein
MIVPDAALRMKLMFFIDLISDFSFWAKQPVPLQQKPERDFSRRRDPWRRQNLGGTREAALEMTGWT